MPKPSHSHKPSASAGTASMVVKRSSLFAISSKRSCSAWKPVEPGQVHEDAGR